VQKSLNHENAKDTKKNKKRVIFNQHISLCFIRGLNSSDFISFLLPFRVFLISAFVVFLHIHLSPNAECVTNARRQTRVKILFAISLWERPDFSRIELKRSAISLVKVKSIFTIFLTQLFYIYMKIKSSKIFFGGWFGA